MAGSKKLVIRGGLDLNGILGVSTSDPVLTRNPSTNEIGESTPLLVGLPTTLLQGYIYIGDNTNTAAARQLSGDISITYLGLATINDGAIINSKVSATAAIAYSKLNLSNSIVNADIKTTAAISRSKLASGAANRIVITNSSGVMIDANAITPNRVLISDVNGLPTDSELTTTVLGYVDPTSSIQTQLNNRLSFSSAVTPNEGDLVVFQSGVWNRFPKGSSGQYLTSTVGGLSWTTTPNGLPIGGAGNEILRKVDSTDYNTEWHTLVVGDLIDITASAAQINVLATGYYDATSSIQTQFSFKLNNALANNAMFVGNSANQVSQLAPGSNGQVLTIVAGVPQWQTVTGTGTVTSVAISGGTTGLSVTGSPITTSGTITLTGTLGTANGGTNLTSYTTGDMLYASSSSVLSPLAIGSNGYVLMVSGGLPSWQPNVASSPLTTKGDIYIYSTTNDRLPVGTDGYHLTADSGQPTGLSWVAPVFNPFSDLNPLVMDNSDNTKLARFEASSITAGTTRVYTLPDASGTLALLGATNGVALSRVDDTNVTLTLSAGSGTALLNATTITVGWTGTLADGRIASSSSWNTAYDRSGTSLGFTSSTFTFTKQDASTLTVSVPTFNQNTTGSAATLTTGRTISITGDLSYTSPAFDGSGNVTASGTLATVNSNVGTFGSATQSTTVTVNGKGLVTAISQQTVTPAVGSITGLGTGVGTWLATPSWTNFNSAITGTAPYWALTGTSTATGAMTIASTIANSLTFNATGTATANNQISKTITGTHTMRNTASDTFTDLYINPSITLDSTTQNPIGMYVDVTYVQPGGVNTLGVLTNGSLAGMTAGTYTNVAPSSTSGSGTGALFTVVVGSATTITSITQTTAGNGYKTLETVTFNGSQFGSGSGTAAQQIRTVTGVSLGTSFTPMKVNIEGVHFLDAPRGIDFAYRGTVVGSLGVGVVSGQNAPAMAFFDEAGTQVFYTTNATGLFVNRPVTLSSTTTISGALTLSSTISSSAAIGGTGLGANVYNSTGAINTITNANTFTSRYRASASTTYSGGLAATISLTSGGTGYTTGTKATTGGTGSGATVSVTTVSGGVITAISSTPIAKGTNYVVGDVLTVSTGGANATVTVTAVDYAGTITSFDDVTSTTDAKSNNNYVSFNARPTYNITSTQVGNIIGFQFNPTLTATGSYDVHGLMIVPTGTKNGIGTGSPNGTLHIVGNGSIPTLKTVGAGTGTNYSIRSFQSDGTTEIFSLKDNGAAIFSVGSVTLADINLILGTSTGTQIGTSASQKLSHYGATPIVQPTTAIAASTFVANTSLIANDSATWDGYTIGQVVKALRNLGLLA